MEILNREEPAYPINEEDCEQQGIADRHGTCEQR